MGQKEHHSSAFYHNDKPDKATIPNEYHEENAEQGQKDSCLSWKKHWALIIPAKKIKCARWLKSHSKTKDQTVQADEQNKDSFKTSDDQGIIPPYKIRVMVTNR